MKKIMVLLAVLGILVMPTKVLASTTENKVCAIVDDIYYGKNGNVCSTSNAYANVIGIEKAAGTMTPE